MDCCWENYFSKIFFTEIGVGLDITNYLRYKKEKVKKFVLDINNTLLPQSSFLSA